MKLILLGPPGAGKGTQAKFISNKFELPAISTGDLLRKEVLDKTELGLKVKEVIDQGNLVEDSFILEIVSNALKSPLYKNGYLLDGFPRTLNQAKMMDHYNINVDLIIEIQVPDEVIVERLSERRIHPGSNRIYHSITNPPKKEGIDDITGEPLIMRKDDKPEVIKERLKIYHSQTKPLVEYYSELSVKKTSNNLSMVKIDGTKDVNEIKNEILSIVEKC